MSTVARWIVNTVRGHGSYIQAVNIGTTASMGSIGVNRHSGVFATICELSQPSGEPLDYPFIGSANMVIQNIAPKDDGTVDIWVNINWPSDLNIRIQILVCND